MDVWVIGVLLLDVVQATGVWFQNGRVVEHLVERDAQEDHVELKDNRQGREGRTVLPLPLLLNRSTL